MSKMRKNSGFTLIELLIIVALIAVLTSIAVPTWRDWMPTYRLKSAARELHSIMQVARLAAVKYNTSVILSFNNAGGHDAIVFEDLGGVGANQSYDPDEKMIRSFDLPPFITISSNNITGQLVRYNTRGMPSVFGTVTVQNKRNELLHVVLSRAGHSRIVKP